MSLEQTLANIDKAIGCQQCDRELGESVSDDFCSERCQINWHRHRVGAEGLDVGWLREERMALLETRPDEQPNPSGWTVSLVDRLGGTVSRNIVLQSLPMHIDVVQAVPLTWSLPGSLSDIRTRRFYLAGQRPLAMQATYIEA